MLWRWALGLGAAFYLMVLSPAWAAAPCPTIDDVAPVWTAPEELGFEASCEAIDIRILRTSPTWQDEHPLGAPVVLVLRAPQHLELELTAYIQQDDSPPYNQIGIKPMRGSADHTWLFVLPTDEAQLREGLGFIHLDIHRPADFASPWENETFAVTFVEGNSGPTTMVPPIEVERYRQTFRAPYSEDGCAFAVERNTLRFADPRPSMDEGGDLLHYVFSAQAIAPRKLLAWERGRDARYTFAEYAILPDELQERDGLLEWTVPLQAQAHCFTLEAVTSSLERVVLGRGCQPQACLDGADPGTEEPQWDTQTGDCPVLNPFPLLAHADELSAQCGSLPDDIYEPSPPEVDPVLAPTVEPTDVELESATEPDVDRRDGNWGGCACRVQHQLPSHEPTVWLLVLAVCAAWTRRRPSR